MADRLRRINIPTPNAALAEWLTGPECRAAVEEVTSRIYTVYARTLPASEFDPDVPGSGQQNLRRHAYWNVYQEGDRWFGEVGNDALSYRPQRGQPYPRYIEYGKPSKGVPGQGQLRAAAHLVAGGLSDSGHTNLPGISHAERGRGSRLRDRKTGRFVSNPLNRD